MTAVFLTHDTMFANRSGQRIQAFNNFRTDFNRPCVKTATNTFILCEEIHNWFVELKGKDYHHEVHLRFIASQAAIPPKGRNYWDLLFEDPGLAILFKLTWGGK